MNKRGLIGWIIIAALVILVLAGATFYIRLGDNPGDIQIGTGKVSVDINYHENSTGSENNINETNENESEVSIIPRVEGNDSYNNIIGENISLNYTDLS